MADDVPLPSPSRVAAGGILSTGSSQVARLVLQLGVTAALARLLTPRDFGLVAMTLAVLGIGEILRDSGLTDASVRLPRLPPTLRNNLFWLNTATGLGLGLLAAATAPLLARFYGEPDLVAVVLGFAPMFVLAGLSTQHRVGLLRDTRFGTLAVVDLAAMAIGAVAAVGCAVAGLGVWSLVAQLYVSGLVLIVLLWVAGGWRPGRPRRGQGTRSVVVTGLHLLGSSVLAYVTLSIDAVAAGRVFGTSTAGAYNRSSTLVRTPGRQLAAPVRAVMLPVLAQTWGDRDGVVVLARRAQLLTAVPLILIAVLATGAPSALVGVVLGPGWDQAAVVVPYLAFAQLVNAVGGVMSLLLVVGGHSRPLLALSVVTTAVHVALVLAGVQYGLVGLAVAVVAGTVVTWAAALVVVARVTGLPAASVAGQAVGLFATALAVSGLARWVVSLVDAPDPVLLLLVAACSLVAVPLLLMVPGTRRDLLAGWQFLRRRLGGHRYGEQPAR